MRHIEQMNFEIKKIWNDLSSRSSMKGIDEKLTVIGLVVDIWSKLDFIEIHTSKINISAESTIPLKSHPQWEVHNHTCDLQSGLLNTQTWYGQTLLGSDQSGNGSKKFTVNMTVNGF